MGDIHGAHRALEQCLTRSGFDYANDTLISLGDVCDGWPETKASIDELLKIKNLIYILGNHDLWTLHWMQGIDTPDVWLNQGGQATVDSYTHGVPEAHITFLQKALPYYKLNNKLFVHAGIDLQQPLEQQTLNTFLWDRTLAHVALDLYQQHRLARLTEYEEVYIGHTPIAGGRPIRSCEIWLMDTGAGWSGPLTMMDINTKEIIQSDNVPSLYPGVMGRRRN